MGVTAHGLLSDTVRPVYHLPGTICTIREFFALAAEAVDHSRTEDSLPVPRVPFLIPYRLAWSLAMINDRMGRALMGRPFGFLPDPSLVEMASRYWSMESRYAGEDLNYQPRPGRETLADTVEWLYANQA